MLTYDSDMPEMARWLALALRLERQRRRWSQEELAAKAGIARSHLGEIETGNFAPTVATLERLATALDMKVSAIFVAAEREQAEGERRTAGRVRPDPEKA